MPRGRSSACLAEAGCARKGFSLDRASISRAGTRLGRGCRKREASQLRVDKTTARHIGRATFRYKDLAASRIWSGRARTRRSPVRLIQRMVPEESMRNSAGRATSWPLTPAPLCSRS